MESSEKSYTATISNIEERLLSFLRFFEKLQEDIHFAKVTEAQERLREETKDLFPQTSETLAALTPPEAQKEAHRQLAEAVNCFADAVTKFLSGQGRDFGQAFVDSRQALCRGFSLAYAIRAQLPTLQSYWVLPEALANLAAIETRGPSVEVPVGLSRQPSTNAHAEYSLYVPENYTSQSSWPLIVCLHGGYGHGNEYIWTWLRLAKSRGYLLLSPKSAGPTWSVLNPPLDIGSIRTMLEEVRATYNVDAQRIYLSGLSDGATFSYLLGLSCSEIFAGIAPIAGDLHPMVDPLLRQKKGINVPLFIVHGAKDFIFDVRGIRSATELLGKIGYKVTYTELPEWGHAYTHSINEQLVLPWFATLQRDA